ncbi:hypothetical protein MBLNU457_g1035t1 [Dothideomycetes sp. NU457]
MDQSKAGADALAAKDYAEAIKAYTQAIRVSPTSPDYFIKRSTAYQRSSPPDYPSAFADAENAVIFAQDRAKRELIIQAQMRRAIALFGLERYADAAFVLDIVKRMDPKEKTIPIWENKIKTKLAALDAEDPKAKLTVKEKPEPAQSNPSSTLATRTRTEDNSTTSATTTSSAPAPTVAQTPADKIRHDWYQNAENVYFTLLAKGVPKDQTTIVIQDRSLSISFPLNTGSSYDFSLDPLYFPIDPSKSIYKILSTKIEVTLKKVQPGQKWHSLESSESVSSTADTNTRTTFVPPPAAKAAAPSYPSSSRTGPKNWDKLAADLTAKKPKDKTTADKKDKDSKTNDDDDDYDYDKEDGDEVNSFFKKLYKDANPDVRRAMMKSFQESNGTALSTNWEEVSKATVPTQPPNGVEAKPWGK